MKLLRTLLAAAAFAVATGASAAVDYTDTWWQPSEPGWGASLTHVANTINAAFYVYGPDGRATWFATLMTRDGTAERFTGAVMRVTGTWYGAPVWNGSQVTVVGTATFTPTSAHTATLVYSVDGLTLTKSLERTFLATLGVAGTYIGGTSGKRAGCSANGTIVDPMQFDVLHSTVTGSIRIDHISTFTGALICRMEGTAVQRGKLLLVEGASYSCTGGWTSTARIYNLRPTAAGFEGQYAADAGGGCTESGQFSGVTQFP
jgi:hypothetical protein